MHVCNQCDHTELEYCNKCGKVYCKKCGKEWLDDAIVPVIHPSHYPSYEYCPNKDTSAPLYKKHYEIWCNM